LIIGLPLTCPDGYNCISTVSLQAAWACCNEIQCLGNWGLCNEYGESGCGRPISMMPFAHQYTVRFYSGQSSRHANTRPRTQPDNVSTVRKQIHIVFAMLEVLGSGPRRHTIPGHAAQRRQTCSLLSRSPTEGTATQTLTRRPKTSFPSRA
jgi:hypothetical protein